jgi:ATP-dependent protease ClpP protease subunit
MAEGTKQPEYVTEEGKAKLIAETEKLREEIREVHARRLKEQEETLIKKHEEQRAEAKHALEMEALAIAIDKGKLQRDVEQVVRDRQMREERMILACDWNHMTYSFSEPVDSESVHTCMAQLNQWVRTHKAEGSTTPLNIEIVFDSPGGSVFDGMHLFDYIRWVRSQGHRVTTVALGNAASMAGILIQAGDERVIGKESYLLIHKITEARWLDVASSDEYEDRLERLKKMEARIWNIFANRAADVLLQRQPKRGGKSRGELVQETLDTIKRQTSKRDWWLDSDECLQFGFVDTVR